MTKLCQKMCFLFHIDAPADCTFEDVVAEPVCRFTQDANDNFDWQSNSGKTPTRRTGPSRDHTLDNSRGEYDRVVKIKFTFYSNKIPHRKILFIQSSVSANEKEGGMRF